MGCSFQSVKSGNVWQLPICSLHHMVWQFFSSLVKLGKATKTQHKNTTVAIFLSFHLFLSHWMKYCINHLCFCYHYTAFFFINLQTNGKTINDGEMFVWKAAVVYVVVLWFRKENEKRRLHVMYWEMKK